MRKRTAAIGSAVMFIVGPGLVIGVVPWLLTRWQFRDPTPYWAIFRVLGVLLILAGLVVLIQAFARFVTEGFGTPLPAAPPTHLVVGGIYRWVRNPIYVAALAVILGQAVSFGQLGPLVYAARRPRLVAPHAPVAPQPNTAPGKAPARPTERLTGLI